MESSGRRGIPGRSPGVWAHACGCERSHAVARVRSGTESESRHTARKLRALGLKQRTAHPEEPRGVYCGQWLGGSRGGTPSGTRCGPSQTARVSAHLALEWVAEGRFPSWAVPPARLSERLERPATSLHAWTRLPGLQMALGSVRRCVSRCLTRVSYGEQQAERDEVLAVVRMGWEVRFRSQECKGPEWLSPHSGCVPEEEPDTGTGDVAGEEVGGCRTLTRAPLG